MSVRLELSTGFTVEVTPLPPFSLDALREKYKEPEPFSRPVKLISGAMDKVPYVLPDSPPVPEDGEEYELWVKYQAQQKAIQDLRIAFAKERIFFLLAKCVKVIDGPSKIEDMDWQENLKMSEIEIPVETKKKFVLWLFQEVIGTPLEQMLITDKYAVYEEVEYSDVVRAIEAMDIKYQNNDIFRMMKMLPSGSWDYDLRLTEMQVCLESNKSPKEWYEMGKEERTQLIAAYLAPKWMESVDFEVSRRKQPK